MRTPASPERKRYRGAVIGAGGIARQSHLPALRDAAALRGRVEVVALVDSAANVPPVDSIPLLGRRDQLRDLAPLDFIDICTPTASHLELTLWGLEQGYHVVCEKPVALTRGEAEGIAAAARASGSAWTGRLRPARYEVEDTASLRFDYPGRLVTMFFTWAARARENRIRFVGDEGAIEWTGGELRLERAGAVERLDYSAELEKTAYHRWFAGLFEGFVAALDRSDPGAAAGPFLEDIRRVASVVEHAYVAARNGATVAIPDDA